MRTAGQRFHQKEHHARHQRKGQALHVRLDFGTFGCLKERHDPQSNPHGKRIERSDIRIIPFTRLKRRLVEVHHNGQSCHQEQQAHNGSALRVSERLESQSHQTQDQRHIKEVIQPSVVLHVLGERTAIPQTLGINEIDATQPIAVHEIAVTLNVILLADEIPEEVSEIHPPHLVIREEPQILPLRRDEIFKRVVESTFCLQGFPNVVLTSGLVRPLSQSTQVVFLRLLLASQALHVTLPRGQASFKLAEHQRGHTCPLLTVGQHRPVHLTRFWISDQQVVFALQFKVGAKTLVVIRKQPTHHPLEFPLRHACPEDVTFQVSQKLRASHRHVGQWARVQRGRVETLVVAPLLVLPDMRSRGAVHAREHHGEGRVVVGL